MANVNDLMNVFDAAEYLGVHTQTLRRLARKRRIPAFKVGRDWRFRKEALVRWADEQGIANQYPIGFSVLVIDDEEKVCNLLARMLGGLGCRSRCARSGAAALELIAQEVPDLILLDLKMPDMSGPQVLEELRKEHPELPVAIVTGYPDSELMHEASRHAPLMVLAKPVEKEQLDRTVRLVFGGPRKIAANGVV